MESTFTETNNRDTGALENIRISNVNFSNADVTISSDPEQDNPSTLSSDSSEQETQGEV